MAKNTPEDRFKRILDSFRRKIEGQPVGFVVAEGSSRTTMMGTNKVTSELIQPTTADGHFKAVITVTSQSHTRSAARKSAEDAEREKNAKNQGKNALDDPKEKKASTSSSPIWPAQHTPKALNLPRAHVHPDEDVVTRRPNEDVRKYELVDDGEHWVLITKPDPKTEQSIEFAFDRSPRPDQ